MLGHPRFKTGQERSPGLAAESLSRPCSPHSRSLPILTLIPGPVGGDIGLGVPPTRRGFGPISGLFDGLATLRTRLAVRPHLVEQTFLLFVGNVPLVWVSFERVHVLPLIMPAFGLIILSVLVVGRRCFAVD